MAKKIEVMLFTSPTCPHCISARNLLDKKREEYRKRHEVISYFRELSLGNPASAIIAKELGIMSVPTFIFKNHEGKLFGKIGSFPESDFDKYVNRSLGMEEPKVEIIQDEKKPGFLSKLFRKN